MSSICRSAIASFVEGYLSTLRMRPCASPSNPSASMLARQRMNPSWSHQTSQSTQPVASRSLAAANSAISCVVSATARAAPSSTTSSRSRAISRDSPRSAALSNTPATSWHMLVRNSSSASQSRSHVGVDVHQPDQLAAGDQRHGHRAGEAPLRYSSISSGPRRVSRTSRIVSGVWSSSVRSSDG